LSAEEPAAVDTAPPVREKAAPPPAGTPPSIVFALLLFSFAIATPFIGELDARDAKGDGGWASLGVFLGWMLAGAAAAFAGIVCTIVGARRAPRSGWTGFAVFLAILAGIAFLSLLVLASR
jgi:hypothetical protein